jgi:hypothetical protein
MSAGSERVWQSLQTLLTWGGATNRVTQLQSQRSQRGKRSDPSHGANARPKAGAVPVATVPTRTPQLVGVSAPCPASRARQSAVEPGKEASLVIPGRQRPGRSRHETEATLAALSGVGEQTARESESAKRLRRERVRGEHPPPIRTRRAPARRVFLWLCPVRL